MLLPTVFLGLTTLLLFFLYLKERRRSRQIIKDFASSTITATQEKSYGLLHRAIKKAQEILGMAELEGMKVITESRVRAEEMERTYQQGLSESLAGIKSQFSQDTQAAEEEFIKYLKDLQARSEQTESLISNMSKQRITELFERFEQSLSTFLTQTQQQSTAAIELELHAARQLIDTYKSQQLALIDENIVAMLEKTLSLVIAKKLTLKDQTDLVYEALEKAKIDKFIV